MINHKTLAVVSCIVLVVIIGMNMRAVEESSDVQNNTDTTIDTNIEQKETNGDTATVVEGQAIVSELHMEGKGLTKLPEDVLNNFSLEVLNLSHNNLVGALPAEIRHLSKLRVLDISYNEFTGVPAEVGQLSELRELNLSYNNLTGLPHEIGNLQNLELLDVRGNEYSEFDMNVIREALPDTTEILVN